MFDTAAASNAKAAIDAASIRNAFVTIALSLAVILCVHVTVVYFIFSEWRVGMTAGIATGLCSAIVGYWAKVSDAIIWPVRIFLTVAILCAAFVASINGGVDGIIAPFLIIIPVIAGYFLGARSSIFFGGLTILCVIGLHAADLQGLVIESPFDPGVVRTAGVAVVIACIMLALVTSSFFASRVSMNADRIENSRALLSSMADVAVVGGWALDIKTMQVVWTEQTRIIHEVDEEYVPALESAIDFYAPDARATIEEAVQNCIDANQPFDLELPLITAAGRNIWVRAVGRRIDEGGVPVRLIGAFQDITDRVKYEKELRQKRIEAESASVAKSQFLATMSHEIRTPMNGVLGMLELIRRGELSEEQQRHATIAEDSAQQLLRIINDVLDFSKIEAGQVDLESIPFNVRDLIDHAVSLMAVRAGEKGLKLSFEVDDTAPPWMLGDPTRIMQVLLNLIGNAVKFTNRGGIVVKAVHGSEAGGALLKISVEDTGIGIPEEDQARLFERFIQADSSTTRRFGGSGLGLAISKQLVDLMGGEISVKSAPGSGSTFSFTVPAEPTTQVKKPPATAPGRGACIRSDKPLNILIAEDNAVNQMIVETFLRAEGHKVQTVNNGAEAVSAMAAQPFDLVLMDIQMPVMDGVAATRAIRAMAGPASGVAIIALTADAMESDRENYLACGMDDYLSKPVQSAALIEAVHRVMARGETKSAPETVLRDGAQSA